MNRKGEKMIVKWEYQRNLIIGVKSLIFSFTRMISGRWTNINSVSINNRREKRARKARQCVNISTTNLKDFRWQSKNMLRFLLRIVVFVVLVSFDAFKIFRISKFNQSINKNPVTFTSIYWMFSWRLSYSRIYVLTNHISLMNLSLLQSDAYEFPFDLFLNWSLLILA